MHSLGSQDDSINDETNAVVDELIHKLRDLCTEDPHDVQDLVQLEQEANLGDVSAMHQLGRVRQYGLSDLPEAIMWYGKASKKCSIESADGLRNIVDSCENADLRIAALIQLREAADAGAKPAALRLARALERGIEDDIADLKAALEIYSNLSMDGDEDAAEGLGRIAINDMYDLAARRGAIRSLREAGMSGNGCATYLLASIYEEGSGVVMVDAHEAVRLYGAACKGGEWWAEDSVSALDRLAKGLDATESDHTVSEDVRRAAVQQLQKAAMEGSTRAALILANIMSTGLEFLQPDLNEAVNLYGTVCRTDADDVSASKELARVIRTGSGITSIVKSTALQQLREAADLGLSQAGLELAYIMEDGADGVPVDLEAAVEIYGVMCISSHEEDQAPQALIRIAESGEWFPASVKKAAVQKLKDATNAGNVTAKTELARILSRGTDVCRPDFCEAVVQYAELVKESPYDSAEALGRIARGGDDVPTDAKNLAFRELSKAVDDGVFTAKYEVALILHEGTGSIATDIQKAVQLYGELCTQLFGGAADRLAAIVNGGDEIPDDVKKDAVQHLIEATKLGFAPATYEVAQIVEQGTGPVNADLREAVKLYGSANRKEHARALSALFRLAKGIDFKDKHKTVSEEIQRSALQELHEAAKDGDDFSALRIAELAENGTTCHAANMDQAIALYGQLAIGLDYDAVEALVRISRNSNGTRASAAQQHQACELLQEASRNENEYAALMLARVFEEGTPSIPQDLNKAVELYISGSQQGNQAAIESLGRIVRNAETDESMRWRAFSTLQNEVRFGSRGAMMQVAETLECGARCMPADPKTSLELYLKLCQMGNDEVMNFKATVALGRLARSDDGVGKEAKASLERAVGSELNEAALQVLAGVLVNGKEEDQDMGRAIRMYRTIGRMDLMEAYSRIREEDVEERLLTCWNWKRKLLGKLEMDSMKMVADVVERSEEGSEGERAVNGKLGWLLRKKVEAIE